MPGRHRVTAGLGVDVESGQPEINESVGEMEQAGAQCTHIGTDWA